MRSSEVRAALAALEAEVGDVELPAEAVLALVPVLGPRAIEVMAGPGDVVRSDVLDGAAVRAWPRARPEALG